MVRQGSTPRPLVAPGWPRHVESRLSAPTAQSALMATSPGRGAYAESRKRISSETSWYIGRIAPRATKTETRS